ncbi:MAG: hypothetical protein IT260_08255 [Saprospiraceae bacterium]|nr:hypothetical protein [Saprospiraceae bacterium]
MEIAFGFFVLVIFLVAFYQRRQTRKTWVAEERQEERGDWIDKRAGERGTYGSLDAEREQERKTLAQQGRAIELARLVRTYAFDHYPGFHELSDAQLKAFSAYARLQAAQLIEILEALLAGRGLNQQSAAAASGNVHAGAIKTILLDYAYAQFPALLDLELETIKALDQQAAGMADALLANIEAL